MFGGVALLHRVMLSEKIPSLSKYHIYTCNINETCNVPVATDCHPIKRYMQKSIGNNSSHLM